MRVHPITTGAVMWPEDALHTRGGRLATLRFLGLGSERTEIPVPVFLIEHPVAGRILVDTGFHGSVAVDPRASLGRGMGWLQGRHVRMGPDDSAPDQLRARGIDPASVGVVVLTHLHSDHASGLTQFPDATFILDRREWAAATEGRALRRGYVRRQFDHAFDYRLVDFGAPEVNSYASFGRSLDLFGDGSVRLVSTPGHTLGHMSVVARLRERELLIAADAAYTMRTIRESALPYGNHDDHEFRRSLREVQLYIQQRPDAVVVPGHDLEAFRALERVYD